MQLKRLSNGEIISLDAELAAGGEGKIYEVKGEPSLVAKVYHQGKNPDEDKLKVMFANPPQDPASSQNHVSIAWTVDLLCNINSQQIVGFLMSKVANMRPIHSYYTPRNRRQHLSGFNYFYLHRTARNLAAAMSALHARDYVVGDVNESNILVAETALITLVDTDSFQVRDPQNGMVYRCPVGKPEFTPPELQGKNFRDIDRSPKHDLFGLGVLIFQLLMEGTHPFEGIFQGTGDPPPKEKRISAGHFSYSQNTVPYLPKPLAPSFDTVSPTLQKLFLQCFEDGHQDPKARPDAQTWLKALEEAEKDLITCSANKNHLYGNHLNACPWCERTVKLKGRDPFPEHQPVTHQQTPLPSPSKSVPSNQPSNPQLTNALNQSQKLAATCVSKGKQFYSSQFPIALNYCQKAAAICVTKGKQFYSSNKKAVKLSAIGLISLVVMAFAVNFISKGIEAARIREQEKQAAIKAEQERQAAIKAEQERQAAIKRRQAAEREERERLAALRAEAERKERERLAVIAAQRAAREAALRAEAEKKEKERLAAIEAEKAEEKRKEKERLAAIEAEEAALKAALEAPRPWESKISIKSNSDELKDVIRGENK